MKNLLKLLNVFYLLPIVASILLPKNLYGTTDNLILSDTSKSQVKVDTISKKVINIYLTKGLEARKLVFVLRKQITLDSQVISLKDTVISKYVILNKDLDSRLKQKENELVIAVKEAQREYFWKRVFQGTTLFFAALFLAK